MPVTDRVYGAVTVSGVTQPLVIGGTTPREQSGGASNSETGVEVQTQQSNTAATARVTVLDDVAAGETIAVSLAGDRVFTGTARKTQDGVGDRTRIVAFDALHDLKRTTISETFDRIQGRDALRRVAAKAGIEIDVRSEARTSLTVSFKSATGDSAVEKLTKLLGAVWYVNAENALVVTDPGRVGDRRELRRVVTASAGKTTPAYQSVRVTGNSATSRRGRSARHLVASQPVRATAGRGNPTFEYEDNDISSQQQAQNVADALLRRLEQQQRSGSVTVVGRGDIRPFDTVAFPDGLGGEEYLVESVAHRINSRDGFLTQLSLGGLVSGPDPQINVP